MGVIQVSELSSIFLPANTRKLPNPVKIYVFEPRVYDETKKVSMVTVRTPAFIIMNMSV